MTQIVEWVKFAKWAQGCQSYDQVVVTRLAFYRVRPKKSWLFFLNTERNE